ncbi:uncharacterized protein FIBRA_06975 [Fibroporia radiculosa]|uniref:Uncharacterized protein n=1 Tax=Fibroporia radiculosa TaxID=599839 RepID=J4H4D1_9APHY|nr:uncharacterized protein FIBRA_06975 [Fibroporia radiculosa]CCM04784.1 predicted protein [Fibroporia radiculosa]
MAGSSLSAVRSTALQADAASLDLASLLSSILHPLVTQSTMRRSEIHKEKMRKQSQEREKDILKLQLRLQHACNTGMRLAYSHWDSVRQIGETNPDLLDKIKASVDATNRTMELNSLSSATLVAGSHLSHKMSEDLELDPEDSGNVDKLDFTQDEYTTED